MQAENTPEQSQIRFDRSLKIGAGYSLEPQADLIALKQNNVDLASLFVMKSGPNIGPLDWQCPHNSIVFQIQDGVRIVINRDNFSINGVDHPIKSQSNHEILYDYLSRFAASITAEQVRNYLVHIGIPEEYRGLIDWLDNRK